MRRAEVDLKGFRKSCTDKAGHSKGIQQECHVPRMLIDRQVKACKQHMSSGKQQQQHSFSHFYELASSPNALPPYHDHRTLPLMTCAHLVQVSQPC
jgi:hypothetical protein